MKSTDLRVGNLVLHNKQIFEIYDIISTQDSVIIGQGDDTGGLQEVFISEIEPIQLTEKRLLKCGFKDEGTHLKLNLRNNWCYEWFNNLLGFSLCKGRRGMCLGRIIYVHELQNLHYSLTGQELNVTNLFN